MQRNWLSSYPPGIPADVEVDWIAERYGLTETAPIVCANPLDLRQFAGATGLLPPGQAGDIGLVEERGYLRLIDRKKDMIVVSGLKVRE